jgi:hypothetical protein
MNIFALFIQLHSLNVCFYAAVARPLFHLDNNGPGSKLADLPWGTAVEEDDDEREREKKRRN